MGKEWVSKKDPREICERTINYSTGTYYTIKRKNPEYIGLSLEEAKKRQKLKEQSGPDKFDLIINLIKIFFGLIFWIIVLILFIKTKN